MNSIPPSEAALRAEIVRVGRLLYEKSLVVAGDGNISARLDDNRILTTPSGLCKGMMSEDQLVIIDMAGRRVDTPTDANRHLHPTSEISMHLEVYKQRPDVRAVVHAHPPHAVALSIANISLADCMLPEVIVTLGLIQTMPYSTPSTPENARAIQQAIKSHDAVVLQRHGSLTVGQSPLDAFFKTETVEQIGRITYMLRTLGGGDPLPPEQVEKLLAQRRASGRAFDDEAGEFCESCGVCHPHGQACADTLSTAAPSDDLVERITRQVMEKLAQK